MKLYEIDPSIVVCTTHGFCQFYWNVLPFFLRSWLDWHRPRRKICCRSAFRWRKTCESRPHPGYLCSIFSREILFEAFTDVATVEPDFFKVGTRPVDVLEVYVLVGRLWIGIKGTVTAKLGAGKVHGNSGANSRGNGRKVDERENLFPLEVV